MEQSQTTQQQLEEQVVATQNELETMRQQCQEEVEGARTSAELKLYQTVERERAKWEERETRLWEQLRESRGGRSRSTESPSGEAGGPSSGVAPKSPGPTAPRESAQLGTTDTPTASALATALLSQQLPPLPKFGGDNAAEDGETFEEWAEQYELVASACGWGEKTKLVNLTTRLRGQAYAFYRSCTASVRNDYAALTAELKKRFTPVRLQAVQSSQFHEKKQKSSESVDSYAQDVHRLFYKAYPLARQGNQEAEEMGKAVLASQFVSGLLPEIKRKVAGAEGSFDQLLVKARYEEAKLRDLSDGNSGRTPAHNRRTTGDSSKRSGGHGSNDGHHTSRPGTEENGKARSGLQCFHCHGTGHFARECPLKGRADPKEAKGRGGPPKGADQRQQKGGSSKVAALTTVHESGETPQQCIERLRRELHEAEVAEALERVTTTMRVLKSPGKTNIGPAVSASMEVEGAMVNALVDTGSPVTIASLDFLLGALGKQRLPSQTPQEWEQGIKNRIRPPSSTLQGYGGGDLHIVGQLECDLSSGGYHLKCQVLIQKGAPVPLLIGTDVLPKLGFLFLRKDQGQTAVDLLGGGSWKIQAQKEDAKPPAARDDLDTKTGRGELAEETAKEEPDAKTRQEELTKEKTEPITVRLLHATRLPPRHARFVKARLSHPAGEGTLLFEAGDTRLPHDGLVVEEAATQPDEEGCIRVVIQNHNNVPLGLDEGQALGGVQPVQVVTDVKMTEITTVGVLQSKDEDGVQNNMTNREERLAKLLGLTDWEQPHLTSTEQCELKTVLANYADVFMVEPTELGATGVVEHEVDTGDSSPVRQPPRRIPFNLRTKVAQMVDDMLDQDIIQPSQSPWSSPIVLTTKKDGSARFCIDYRRVNAVTKPDVYPLPRVDDSLDLLAQSRYFTTLDLAAGYWQVKMGSSSQEKTAFVTHSGLYEFKVMPFGLRNAPATFQRLMEQVLAGLVRDKCLVYIDDILVVGQTFHDHLLRNLRAVLDRLREAGLRLKPTKCHFAKEEVEYLGYW